MEQDARDAATVARSQNVVYVMPHDWTSIAQFLGPLVERVDETSRDVQLLVVASDAEVAAAIGAAAVRLTEHRDIGILAATSAPRAARLLRMRPAQIVSGAPETLLDLVRGTALKLDTVRVVCVAWTGELLDRQSGPALETLMTELSKETPRVFVTANLTPAVEELLERYARRARRVVMPSAEGDQPVDVEYVTTSLSGRFGALRRVLDELDPASAIIFVRDREIEPEVRDLLRSLGYPIDGDGVRVGAAAAPGTGLAVLFDLPASREELREAAAGATRRIALVQPRQINSLRALSAGGALKPFILAESGQRARDRDARARAELRAVLDECAFGRELIALEPLLDDYDGIEIAAATLQLLERERHARDAEAQAALHAAPRGAARERAPAGSMVRLFVNIGSRDNVGPGDLVGAIANQGKISSAQLGRVEIRESHSIVEVAPDVANDVVERVTGAMIRGRRAVLRVDEERPRREGRPPRRDDRSSREDRPRRDDRPHRDSRPPRDDRPRRESRPRRDARPSGRDRGNRE